MPKPGNVSLPDSGQTAGGSLVRLGWFLGTGSLAISTFLINQNRSSLSAADAVFGITAAACILLRYLDIRWLHGRTVTDEPATLRHWWRYAILMLVISTVVWGAAHGVAFLK